MANASTCNRRGRRWASRAVETRPAASSTLRCFEMVGCVSRWGSASSDTVASPCARRARIARRVGSASAPNKASSCAGGGELASTGFISEHEYNQSAILSIGNHRLEGLGKELAPAPLVALRVERTHEMGTRRDARELAAGRAHERRATPAGEGAIAAQRAGVLVAGADLGELALRRVALAARVRAPARRRSVEPEGARVRFAGAQRAELPARR